MAKRWTVSVGFSDLSRCEPHDPMRPCNRCSETGMLHELDVTSESSCDAISAAVFQAMKNARDDGYSRHSVVSADIVRFEVVTDLQQPSPQPASAQKPRSPREPKGSTAAKKGSARKRGGKGQRKA